MLETFGSFVPDLMSELTELFVLQLELVFSWPIKDSTYEIKKSKLK